MIFYFNSDGTPIFNVPTVIVQGSSVSNRLFFVAPNFPGNAVSVAFTLPSGVHTQRYLMTLESQTGLSGITDLHGRTFYVWTRELPAKVTKMSGNVICQFFCTNTTGETLAFTPVQFDVSQGVSFVDLSEDTEHSFDDILAYISELFTVLSDEIGDLEELSTTQKDTLVNAINEIVVKKLNKLTPENNGTYVYSVVKDGNTVTNEIIKAGNTATTGEGTVVLRWTGNQIIVPLTPTQPTSATSKSYVDGIKTELNNLITAIQNVIPTGASSSNKLVKTSELTAEKNRITAIENKIPAEASSTNELADKSYVSATITQMALPISTKYGANLSLAIDNTNYVITAQLKDQDGANLGNAQTIDLPLESVVVNGRYDATTKRVILTLKNGQEIGFSVADLISGLQVSDLSGAGNPTTSTVGSIGQKYVNTIDNTVYMCTAVSNGSYTWIGLNAKDVTTSIGGMALSDIFSEYEGHLIPEVISAHDAYEATEATKVTDYIKENHVVDIFEWDEETHQLGTIAKKAKSDASGNDIELTYAKKAELPLIITSDTTRTVETFSVPDMTGTQIANAYNAMASGRPVILTSEDGNSHFMLFEADGTNETVSVRFTYSDKLIITYSVNGSTVTETHALLITDQTESPFFVGEDGYVYQKD